MAFNPKNTWYVSFNCSTDVLGNRVSRVTETFQTESEAKEFARSKIAEGRTVNAGTINPHVPRRTMAGAQIYRWLEIENSK
jgi:hypothetical protein